MSWAGFKRISTAFALGVMLAGLFRLLAQVPARSATASGANLLLKANQLAATEAAAPKSPVDLFRELLAMDSFERKAALAGRSPESQRQILAKLREYEALNPDLRELRLQATELHYYLWPLMNSPATNRAGQIAVVPQRSRKLIADRITEWDKLPFKVQEELRDNEATFRFFTELAGSTSQQRSNLLHGISAARRAKLEAGIRQWQDIPRDQRPKMMSRFKQFFELTPAEQTKALSTLSEPERQQLEKTLKQFGALAPHQRAECVSSFEKFAGLSVEERERFLKNAERWKLMSPKERENWKQLVEELSIQPPMPPGLGLPPMPPGMNPNFPPLPPN